MRVYDLAKELGLTNKALMVKLHAMGVEAKNHMSSIDEDVAKRLLAGKSAAAPVSPSLPPKAVKAPFKPAPPQPRPTPPAKPTSKKPAAAARAPKPPSPTSLTAAAAETPDAPGRVLSLRGAPAVRELAEQLGLKPNQLIAELMLMNVFASINARLDFKVAQQVAEKHGFTVEHEKKHSEQKAPVKDLEAEEADRPEDIEARPPVVTFLGHIDHGKTSLLDRIRHTAVAKNEAGGITQHIGAYTIEHQGKRITFLDTPGHAAFTAMRARGANLTDIAVIVIAADDGVMPQTEEAIKHAQAADTTILVAINKIDLPGANPERVKQQLQSLGLTPEEWGGAMICCPVSALTGQGMDRLLEMLLLQAEMLELKANPRVRAQGYVVEAQMETGMGPTAALLITRGTLHVGDMILCGPTWGKVKALINDHGIKVRTATPSMPVKCMGLSSVPQAGEFFKVYANDKMVRALSEQRLAEIRANQMAPIPRKASLQDLFAGIEQNNRPELRLILKCDTQGSLEAIKKALEDIKSEKVSITFILGGVGNINDNDVLLASASNAIIFGFNVSKEEGIVQSEKREGVEIRLYSIIYKMLDEIREAMTGMVAPELREKIMGLAEVKQVFPITKKGKIAGCLLNTGRITSRCRARVKRQNDIIYEGAIITLKRFQDDVSEVREGQECGVRLDNFGEFEPGDMIELFEVEKLPQKL